MLSALSVDTNRFQRRHKLPLNVPAHGPSLAAQAE